MLTLEPYDNTSNLEFNNSNSALPIITPNKPLTSPGRSRIPLLNSISTDSNTYDYERLMSLISPKRPKPLDSDSKRANPALDLANRLLDFQQLSVNRNTLKRLEKENREMESCTFSPRINSKKPRKGFSKFLAQQSDFQNLKRTKIDKKKIVLFKDKQKSDEISGKIEVSPGSQKINLMRNIRKPVHERLYQDSRICKKNGSMIPIDASQRCSPECTKLYSYWAKKDSARELENNMRMTQRD